MLEQNPNWPIHPEHSVAANGFDLQISKFGNRGEISSRDLLLATLQHMLCNVLFTNLDFLLGIHDMQDTLHFLEGFLRKTDRACPML